MTSRDYVGITSRAVTSCNSCPTFAESTVSLLFLSVHKQSYFSFHVSGRKKKSAGTVWTRSMKRKVLLGTDGHTQSDRQRKARDRLSERRIQMSSELGKIPARKRKFGRRVPSFEDVQTLHEGLDGVLRGKEKNSLWHGKDTEKNFLSWSFFGFTTYTTWAGVILDYQG